MNDFASIAIPARKQGFTLIEMSIVLVIIGLLIAAGMVGRGLIFGAEVRAMVKQYQEFDSAVNTFKVKYKCLPGDCEEASSFGFGATNGTGDDYLGATATQRWCAHLMAGCSNQVVGEYANFWYHLSAANLIKYNYVAWSPAVFPDNFISGRVTPPIAIKKTFGSASWKERGWSVFGAADIDARAGGGTMDAHNFMIGSSYTYPMLGYGLAPIDAFAIDEKIDDGLPNSGNVRPIWVTTGVVGILTFNGASGMGAGGIANAYCVANDVTPNRYNIQYPGSTGGFGVSGTNCGLLIRASF